MKSVTGRDVLPGWGMRLGDQHVCQESWRSRVGAAAGLQLLA